MANKPIGMNELKMLLQLQDRGMSKLALSKKLNIDRRTITKYLSKIESLKKPTGELLKLKDYELAGLILSKDNINKPGRGRLARLESRYPVIKEELKDVGMTRLTCWENYRKEDPEPYRYSQFCEHLNRFGLKDTATMHFEHEPGNYMQVDFAGKPLYYVDRGTGEIISCPVLVCTLPYSNYPYVEALHNARQGSLFPALGRCLEYLGGVPKNIISDNMRQYIAKNSRYEFSFTEQVNQWALHYRTNLEATRVRKPKDKPSVESNVRIAYIRIYTIINKETHFSLGSLNNRVKELLAEHVKKPFQKRPGTRHEIFLAEEQPSLTPLPETSFVVRYQTKAKVQYNYHVFLGEDHHYYSVPYEYIGKGTKIVYDTENVEVFIGHSMIAVHNRSYRKYGYTTREEHMPSKHKYFAKKWQMDENAFRAYASKLGGSSQRVFHIILESKEFVQQTYKSCSGLIRLIDLYSKERFEAACKRALSGPKVTYKIIKTILEKNLDKQAGAQMELFETPEHQNIRGKEHYQKTIMNKLN